MLFADSVKLAPDLAATFKTIGSKGTGGINDIYSQMKSRQAQEGKARGQIPGSNSYGADRMGVQQGLDQGALEASLGGQLGDTSYKDALAQREFEQNKALAEETGRLNKPDLLQQIFQGLGSVGKPLASYYGMKGKSGGGGGSVPSLSGGGSAYNIMNPGPLDLGYRGF